MIETSLLVQDSAYRLIQKKGVRFSSFLRLLNLTPFLFSSSGLMLNPRLNRIAVNVLIMILVCPTNSLFYLNRKNTTNKILNSLD